MSLLDGRPLPGNIVQRTLDLVLASRYLVTVAACIFGAALIASPLIFFCDMAHFTAARSPAWLDLVNGLWIAAFLLGGGALALLALARLLGHAHERD